MENKYTLEPTDTHFITDAMACGLILAGLFGRTLVYTIRDHFPDVVLLITLFSH